MDLLSLGKTPINDSQPAGSDVRYDPEFEQLQAEIDKLSNPSASSGLDWQKVSDLGVLILSEKSKNLQVAGYLAVSQVHINRAEGLAAGARIIHDLIDQYWETLFPTKKRLRGRIAALEWWIEKTTAALEGMTIEALASDQLQEITTTLTDLDALLKTHLEEPPLLRPILRIIERIPAEAQEKAVPPSDAPPSPPAAVSTPEPPSSPTPAPAAAPEAAQPPTSDDIRNEADIRKVMNAWQQTLRKVASFLFQKDSADPLAYRYRRIAAWSQVLSPPPVDSGITRLPPPPPQVVQALNGLRENANHEALMESAEQRLSQYIYWFDLNRWVTESMDNLGDGYGSAREAVCQETAFLLYRLPGLRDLAFSDGTPFADPQTRKWLDRLEFNAASAVAVPTVQTETVQTAGSRDPVAETVEKAAGLARKKQLLDAVRLLCEKMHHCYSRKEALTWRLALTQILIGSQRLDLAMPHLDLILKDIDAYQLTRWDPELALKGLRLVWAGFNSHTDKAVQQDADAILNRIAEIDPVEALNIKK